MPASTSYRQAQNRAAVQIERDGEGMYHERVEGKRPVRKRVAATYQQAMDQRIDYYHKGGELVDGNGTVIGQHPPGWFLDGYKWAEQPTHIAGWSSTPYDDSFDEVPADAAPRVPLPPLIPSKEART